MIVNADLHLHGKFSGGTSSEMELPKIAEQAALKGLNLVGTADCLHKRWLSHITSTLAESTSGIFQYKESKTNSAAKFATKFVLQTEVEGEGRIHHLILLPSLDSISSLRTRLSKYGNLDSDGRPKLRISGEDLVGYILDSGGIVGPAHAFTPYTAIYGRFDMLEECYGSAVKEIEMLELGLSANTELANPISELKDITFLTNSDCHSPWPHRIGREFNQIEIEELTFQSLISALKAGKIKRNIGVPCEYGKYHLSRCRKCLAFFHLKDARRCSWRCPKCKGIIKKGVRDRILELSGEERSRRPPYLSTPPLAQLIALSRGIKSETSPKVQETWKKFVVEFGTEIKVLTEAQISDLSKIDPKVSALINSFRQGDLNYTPGGAGEYGKLLLPGKKAKIEFFSDAQTSLKSY